MVGMGEAFGIAFVVIVLIAALHGCGGGGGSSSSPQPPAPVPVPSPRTEPLHYGYFGIDGEQITETAEHVTFVMAPDWGDWNIPNYDEFRKTQIITQLQQAKALGVKDAWIMVGFLVLTQRPGCTEMCVTPRPDGMARLQAFKVQLDALGLLEMVKVLYPIDEPESHGLSDAQLVQLLKEMKTVWPVKMAVFYSSNPHDYPGLSEYDLAGRDDYDAGVSALDNVPPIKGNQQLLIIPGGADPWHADPQPFYDYALAHGNVYAIVPFVWFDRGNDKGIRSNGLAAQYANIGVKIKNGS